MSITFGRGLNAGGVSQGGNGRRGMARSMKSLPNLRVPRAKNILTPTIFRQSGQGGISFTGSGLQAGGALLAGGRQRGSGIMKKWTKDVVDFLRGKKKVKPSTVAKHIGKVFKVVGGIVKQTKYAQYADQFDKASNIANKVGGIATQFGSGQKGMGPSIYFGQGISYGGGKGAGFHKVTEKFADFLMGKTKLKPSMIVTAGGVILGVMSAGAAATGFGIPAAAELGAASAAMFKTSSLMKRSRMEENAASSVNSLRKGSGMQSGSGLFPLHEARQKCIKRLKGQTEGTNLFGRPAKKYRAGAAKRICKAAEKGYLKGYSSYDPTAKPTYSISQTGSQTGGARRRRSYYGWQKVGKNYTRKSGAVTITRTPNTRLSVYEKHGYAPFGRKDSYSMRRYASGKAKKKKRASRLNRNVIV